MSLAIVSILAVLVSLAIVYPLLPGRAPLPAAEPVRDADVERAVRRLRQAAEPCPACGTAYQPGDRFCVRCGQTLPGLQTTACPACGSPLRPEDSFCARCGHSLAGEEVAR